MTKQKTPFEEIEEKIIENYILPMTERFHDVKSPKDLKGNIALSAKAEEAGKKLKDAYIEYLNDNSVSKLKFTFFVGEKYKIDFIDELIPKKSCLFKHFEKENDNLYKCIEKLKVFVEISSIHF